MAADSNAAPVRLGEGKRILFYSSFALCAVAVAIYFIFDPTKVAIFPPCVFHQLTGLDCPGCGAQRALHELLHGNVIAALRLNAIFVLSLPVCVLYAPRTISRAFKGEPTGLSTPWLWFYLAAWLVFGLLRNVPLPIFAWFKA